jgi:hypothetical protein
MREELISFIWKFGLFRQRDLRSVNGAPLQILRLGDLNTFDGPDFENACIRVHGLQWSGAIELHSFSSAWYSHGHDEDPNYDQVVLHVCWVYDREARTSSGRTPVHLQLSDFVDEGIIRSLDVLKSSKGQLLCCGKLTKVPDGILSGFMDRLAKEHLLEKRMAFKRLLIENGNNRERASAIRLGEILGKPGNKELMSLFVQSLDHRIIARKRDQLNILIAYLLGKAGLLQERDGDAYAKMLCSEFRVIEPLDSGGRRSWSWRKKGIRSGDVSIRLVVMAIILQQIPSWHDRDIHYDWKGALRDLEQQIPVYWLEHQGLGEERIRKKRFYTEFIRSNVFINLILPFCLSRLNQREFDHQWPIYQSILAEWKREENRIVSLFRSEGLDISDADRSQAILYLHKHYCQHKKCVNCEIGEFIIRGGHK